MPSSAASPNSRRSSSGFFHNVKRAVLGPSSITDDSDFTSLRTDFLTLHSHLTSLRLHVTAYNKAIQALHSSSLSVSKSYADIISTIPRPHPFSHLLLTLCQAHNDLSDKASHTPPPYTSSLLTVINNQLDLHKLLLARIDQRQQLRSDSLYYTKKVDTLLTERGKRGRADKPGEVEKVERNQAKLSEAARRYEEYHRELLHDLSLCYDTRLTTYGPSLQMFVGGERLFIADYSRAIAQVEGKEEQRISLRIPPPIPAEHSPLVDGSLSVSIDHSAPNPFGVVDPSPIGGLTPNSARGVKDTISDGYPYDRVKPSAPMQSPVAVNSVNPFIGEDEVEGVPNVRMVDRTAGYSDPFANGGGAIGAFFDYGAPHVASPAVVSSSSSSSSSSVPVYQPVLYEPFEAVVEAAPVLTAGQEVVEEEGEEETEEEEIPSHLLQPEPSASPAVGEPNHPSPIAVGEPPHPAVSLPPSSPARPAPVLHQSSVRVPPPYQPAPYNPKPINAENPFDDD
jgi:hypothetical protein